METLLETKIPFYNLVNVFLPGLAFVGSLVLQFPEKVRSLAIIFLDAGSTGLEVLVLISCLAIAYEIGYIIFRFGAIAVEPLLKKLFGWTSYDRFVAAQKCGAKSLSTLSREYAYTRTQITLFVALAGVFALSKRWVFMVISVLCVLLFVLSARGHIKKIAVTVKEFSEP